MNRTLLAVTGIYLVLLIIVLGCKKEIVNSETNPFAGIKPINNSVNTVLPDSHSIVGLHQYTFRRTCALSGCHDGTFEPDFRTVQSSYSTMVFQPVIKNNATYSFKYRVKPGDYKMSWLHEKVVTDDPIISRMPVNLPALSAGEVKAIRRWIEEGAKDMFGNISIQPNFEPVLYGMVAFAKVANVEFRIDTLRSGAFTNPFALPQKVPGQNINITETDIWIGMEDRGEDSTAIHQFQINELMISDKMDDFTNAKIIKATYSSTPKAIPNFLGGRHTVYFFWKAKINPQDFQKDKVYYLRYKVSDGKQKNPTVQPNDSSPIQLKTYASFYVYSG